MVKVFADHNSIKRQIEENIKNPFDAVNEFIWNSIDAKAKNIHIKIKNDSKYIKSLEIDDDGEGINREKLEKDLFGRFNVSSKSDIKEDIHSLPRGKNGFGRFSFIKFASEAKWITTYTDLDNNNYNYEIIMKKD